MRKDGYGNIPRQKGEIDTQVGRQWARYLDDGKDQLGYDKKDFSHSNAERIRGFTICWANVSRPIVTTHAMGLNLVS